MPRTLNRTVAEPGHPLETCFSTKYVNYTKVSGSGIETLAVFGASS